MAPLDASLMEIDRRATNKASVAVYVIVLLDALSFALILPYLPFILMNFGADSRLGGMIVTIHAIGAIISAPILGRISDRVGRRPVLLATMAGTMLAYLDFAFSASIAALLVSRLCAGFMAGNMGVLQASLADATSIDQRGRAMSFLTAAWGMGYVIGPALGAVLPLASGAQAQHVGLLAAGLSALMLALLWRAPFDSDAQVTGERVAEEESTRSSRDGKQSVSTLLLLQALLTAAQTGLAAMAGFWAHAAFGWDARRISLMMAGIAFSMIVVQAIAMPRLFRAFAARTLLAAIVTATAVVSMALCATTNGVILLAGTAFLFCIIMAGQSTVSTIMSEATRRGRMMGLVVSAGAVGRIVGPTAFGLLFFSAGPSAPFFAIASFMVGGVVFGALMRLIVQRG